MDPMAMMAMANAGSRVLGGMAAAEAGPVTSGLSNSGFFGLGNEGMTVNFGGSGLNLQGGAAAGLPSWLGLAAVGLGVFLLWGK